MTADEPASWDPRDDHFRVFGLPRAFVLDAPGLERELLQRSRRCHPDRAGRDPTTRARAILQSAQLNEAYAVLRDAFRRADYLVTLEGGPAAADHKQVPGGFLESMMDLRDEIDEALQAGDADRTQQLRRRLEGELDQQMARVTDRFAALDEPGREARLRAIREDLNQAAYLRGLLRDLREGSASTHG